MGETVDSTEASSSGPASVNQGYVWQLLEDYLRDPSGVDPEWRDALRGAAYTHPVLAPLLEPLDRPDAGADTPETAAAAETPKTVEAVPGGERALRAVGAAMSLVKAHRTHGHLAADLDPLGSEPVGDPALELTSLPELADLLGDIPASILRTYIAAETLADLLPRLKETYCGTLAYEIEHISEHEQRVWLRQAIESGRYRRPFDDSERRRLLERLAEVAGFESYLRRAFLGQKQFSIEGLDVMVPMLEEIVELVAADGAKDVVFGMAHRGRLNVLTHVVGRSYDSILREFEGERNLEAVKAALDEGDAGDVKYHLGDRGLRNTASGQVQVHLLSNPSHLEAVDPVVQGRTRAEQTDRSEPHGGVDSSRAVAVLIHGDASFAAQGVVAETFNLSGLAGYSTGGTVHIIANNQVGFTTDPQEGRSTRYASDLAKGFDVPIVHVNADDPEAAIAAVRLALAYRARFGRDVVIDLVGYRRFGHNEQDEPAYTQPLMAKAIQSHPPVSQIYGGEEAAELVKEAEARVREAHQRLRGAMAKSPAEGRLPSAGKEITTEVLPERLRTLNDSLLKTPPGFKVHPKLAQQLERRRDVLADLDTGGVDWGHAEALAFAALLEEGVPIRLTGQDSERGTFSHRHAVLHDVETGATSTPLKEIPQAQALFEIHNSPLSEYSALGFEYGYASGAPEAMILWEAQFGDFVNGAQIVVDQFIVAGLSKWRQTVRLVLLLPHGYEGNGPEHSSARLERFLQLAAQNNIRVVNCTTAAQYFHLLRRQALELVARPLVVMTPKGLLRLRQAASTLRDLSEGRFQEVIDDGEADPTVVKRLVLCSGKVYYDVLGHDERTTCPEVAVARVEQLYPFPARRLKDLIDRYDHLTEVVWLQEEPQNMGPYRSIRHRLEEAARRLQVRYVGRPWQASPAEGYPTAHLLEQERIVREALGLD